MVETLLEFVQRITVTSDVGMDSVGGLVKELHVGDSRLWDFPSGRITRK